MALLVMSQAALCSGLVRCPILRILLYLAHALYASEGVAPKPEQEVQFGAALSLTTNFTAIGTNW